MPRSHAEHADPAVAPHSAGSFTSDHADHVWQVIGYHQHTKHYFFRYAPGPGHLDWANQPDPFRRFRDAPIVLLPLPNSSELFGSPAYDALYHPTRVQSRPVGIEAISRFLYSSLAVSAWKQAGGTRWALRVNPSSGNLHPTEAYLVLPAFADHGQPAGLYHYAPKEHTLERRCVWNDEAFSRLMRPWPDDAWLLGFSSIYWREAWKYGERAYRYCQHDLGHAIGATRLAAAALGWGMMLLDATSDETVSLLLGLERDEDFDGAEREAPGCLAVVWPLVSRSPCRLPRGLDRAVLLDAPCQWEGHANQLSRTTVPWDMIEVVSEAARKPETDSHKTVFRLAPDETGEVSGPSAEELIRQRRSALAFDGYSSLPATSLFRMLRRVMPPRNLDRPERRPPWDVPPREARGGLGLLGHCLDGLRSGLYLLLGSGTKRHGTH